MRYADAAHVDRTAFHARLAPLGNIFRYLGYILLVALALPEAYSCSPWIIGAVAFAGWFAAWYSCVGSTWRTSLVAALIVSTIQIVLARGVV